MKGNLMNLLKMIRKHSRYLLTAGVMAGTLVAQSSLATVWTPTPATIQLGTILGIGGVGISGIGGVGTKGIGGVGAKN